jgi:amidase
MSTWIVRFDVPTPAEAQLRVAVKDAIDMAGVPTSAGCVAVRDRAAPAPADARCLAGIRAADVAIVGKTTLTELCLSPTGINDEFGTPVNPLAPDRIPGGSSSGSAVAVAGHEADVALGTDTGGSVRIPAACCGIVGLKTTWDRIPRDGVWALSPSLDSVGPIARDVAGVARGMALLEPGFRLAAEPGRVVGRLRIANTDPELEDAVDAALAAAGCTVRPVTLPGWDASFEPFRVILHAEFYAAHADLLDVDGVTARSNEALRRGRGIGAEEVAEAMAARAAWQAEVAAVFADVQVLALPTLPSPPPTLDQVRGYPSTVLTAPFNIAGVPALSLPVPAPGPAGAVPVPGAVPAPGAVPVGAVPPSLQLVAAPGAEDLLCATGLAIEAAVRAAAESPATIHKGR